MRYQRDQGKGNNGIQPGSPCSESIRDQAPGISFLYLGGFSGDRKGIHGPHTCIPLPGTVPTCYSVRQKEESIPNDKDRLLRVSLSFQTVPFASRVMGELSIPPSAHSPIPSTQRGPITEHPTFCPQPCTLYTAWSYTAPSRLAFLTSQLSLFSANLPVRLLLPQALSLFKDSLLYMATGLSAPHMLNMHIVLEYPHQPCVKQHRLAQ